MNMPMRVLALRKEFIPQPFMWQLAFMELTSLLEPYSWVCVGFGLILGNLARIGMLGLKPQPGTGTLLTLFGFFYSSVFTGGDQGYRCLVLFHFLLWL